MEGSQSGGSLSYLDLRGEVYLAGRDRFQKILWSESDPGWSLTPCHLASK